MEPDIVAVVGASGVLDETVDRADLPRACALRLTRLERTAATAVPA